MRLSSLLTLPGYIGAGFVTAYCTGWTLWILVLLCCMWIDTMSFIGAHQSIERRLNLWRGMKP